MSKPDTEATRAALALPTAQAAAALGIAGAGGVMKLAIDGNGRCFKVDDDDPRGVLDDAGPVYREPTEVEHAGQDIPPEGVLVRDERWVSMGPGGLWRAVVKLAQPVI